MISRVPAWRVRSRITSRKPGCGRIIPQLVMAGSASTAATSPGARACGQGLGIVERHDAGGGRQVVDLAQQARLHRRAPSFSTTNASSTMP
jgi:dihydropteroate synthase